MRDRYVIHQQSRSFNKRQKKRQVYFVILSLLIIFTWSYSAYKLFNLEIFNIDQIKIIGVDGDTTSYESAAYEAVSGKYLGLIPKTNTWLYSKKDIEKSIMKSSPSVGKIDLAMSGVNTLVVNIEEKDPHAIFCTSLPDWNNDNINIDYHSCYFIDNTGLIYAEATSSKVKMPPMYYYFPDASFEHGPLGSFMASSSMFALVENVYDKALSNNINVKALLYRGNGEYEMYADNIVIKDPDSALVVIYMNEHNDIDMEMDNLITFWLNTIHGKDMPKTFDSIDLRYGSNVFYRVSK